MQTTSNWWYQMQTIGPWVIWDILGDFYWLINGNVINLGKWWCDLTQSRCNSGMMLTIGITFPNKTLGKGRWMIVFWPHAMLLEPGFFEFFALKPYFPYKQLAPESIQYDPVTNRASGFRAKGCPLVNIHSHSYWKWRNSGFSHWKWWF